MNYESEDIESDFNLPFACAICGEEALRPTHWFLLTENQWLNRIKVLLWSDAAACQPNVMTVSCPEHVQELVAHWMATGSLNYPFARVPGERARREHPNGSFEADTRKCTVVGELAVHRESLSRLLEENPQSLAGMLEALMNGLGRKSMGTIKIFEDAEEAVVC